MFIVFSFSLLITSNIHGWIYSRLYSSLFDLLLIRSDTFPVAAGFFVSLSHRNTQGRRSKVPQQLCQSRCGPAAEGKSGGVRVFFAKERKSEVT